MLLSYLKIAWKVLQRRKFFTFISLFGISFTLMILLVVYALYDHTVGPHTPEKRVDRLLFVTHLELWSPNSQSNSDPSYSFLNRYVRPLRTPEKVSIATSGGYAVAYVGNTKLKLSQKGTDGAFWQVLDFEFLAGRPYSVQEVGTDAHVAVINESTARRYFGAVAGAVGRPLEADGTPYRVVGVVRDVPTTRFLTTADMWIPLGLTVDVHEPNYFGNCIAILLAPSAAALPAMQGEFRQVMRRVPVQDPKQFKELRIYANTLLTTTVRRFVIDDDDEPDDSVARLGRITLGVALLFMLLPALNLVNLNVSRMLERSSEIGVRKAFGATAGRLVGQFLVENIFLTLLGGVLGLGLAAGALGLLNGSSVIEYAQFALNGRVFAVALGAVLFFGLLSGVYPAYKMSKLPAIQALKGGTK